MVAEWGGHSTALGVGVVVVVGFGLAALYRFAWRDAEADAKTWERRARAAGWMPTITPEIAQRIKNDLFPRPMGATGLPQWKCQQAKAWRERRAVTSRDHTKRHFAEGTVASEWATEVMQLCVGGWEIDR